jgi:hypothetical protein
VSSLERFRQGWVNAAHPSIEKYHSQGLAALDELLTDQARLRPFPRDAFFALDTPCNVNPTLLGMHDLLEYEPSGGTVARLIASQTPASNAVVAHSSQADVPATAAGLGKVRIGPPLAPENYDSGFDAPGQHRNHAHRVTSTFMPAGHVTKFHTDYSSASTAVYHFTGTKLWIVVAYTPQSSQFLVTETVQVSDMQNMANVIKAAQHVYVAVINSPTCFLLSPLDHHAVLTLTPSHHASGRLLVRGERAVFRKAHDYLRRLTLLADNPRCAALVRKRAVREKDLVHDTVVRFREQFGVPAVMSASEEWDGEPEEDKHSRLLHGPLS